MSLDSFERSYDYDHDGQLDCVEQMHYRDFVTGEWEDYITNKSDESADSSFLDQKGSSGSGTAYRDELLDRMRNAMIRRRRFQRVFYIALIILGGAVCIWGFNLGGALITGWALNKFFDSFKPLKI